jgi:hypothetical protein
VFVPVYSGTNFLWIHKREKSKAVSIIALAAVREKYVVSDSVERGLLCDLF